MAGNICDLPKFYLFSSCPAQLSCCVRELLEQFVLESNVLKDERFFNVLMHPFTLHSLARGNTLKRFAPCACLSFRIFDAGYRWLVLTMFHIIVNIVVIIL